MTPHPAYLEGLNASQQEGVINTEGSCMIIAGAGSGKTRVLTSRIAHLIQQQRVDPFSIMALTFTNKAAKEMRKRIEDIVGTAAKSIWMGTFHSVFARILRIESECLGYPSNFSIYDTDDSLTLIKAIVKEMKLDDDLYKAKIVLHQISSAKNRLISWQKYLNDPMMRSNDESFRRPEIGNIYRNYALRCFKASAMDFDDILVNTDTLFKEHLNVLNKYQHRIQYILVDEFQDTNLCQYFIARKLASVKQNICVVGDDAQSIYAFRGADITNILNFEKDYPNLRIIKLEQNYRSTKTIVKAAGSVIEKNKAQIPKNIWTSNEEGSPIELLKALSDNEEGKLIALSIFDSKVQNQLSFNDFAILYRTNSQSRALEEALRKMNIKYHIVGGFSFYQRKEVKDLLAYLRFIVNQRDESSLRRIINIPKRGIGNTTINKVIVAANENDTSVWEILKNAHNFVPARAANAITDFVNLIKRCIIESRGKDAYETATSIAKHSGLLNLLYTDKTIEGRSSYENVQELLNAIKEFVTNPEQIDQSLATFLQEIALFTSQDEESGESEKVTLMTMHMAKGLEFQYVYIAGIEEELFPSQLMLGSQADLEEERRLFYVAMTRAKKKLFLSYALTRYRFGRLKNCEPSRFLDDIAPKYIKMNYRAMSKKTVSHHNTDYGQTLLRSIQRTPTPIRFKERDKMNNQHADFVASDTSGLQEGMKVEHPKFGVGTVATIKDSGFNRKAVIQFNNFGKKTLLLSFAKLKIYTK